MLGKLKTFLLWAGGISSVLMLFGGILLTLVLIVGIATNEQSSVGNYSGTTATIYDSSKEQAASAITTNGWDEAWVDKFRLDAGDPPYVTGEYIEQFLQTYYPQSPLIGHGHVIKEFADYYGIAVGAFMGQIAKESTFGINSCGGRYNLGCIRWYEGAPFGPVDTANGQFQNITDIATGIESYFHLVRFNYVNMGQVTYKDYLDKYSPSFENDQSTFKDIFWGALKAFGYDTSDQTKKQNHASEDEKVDGKITGVAVGTSISSGSTSVSIGGGTAGGLENIPLEQTRFTPLVLSWKDELEAEMAIQGVPSQYLNVLLAILATESGGGGTVDIMQSAESLGWKHEDARMTSEAQSIKVGVTHFKNTLAKANGKSIWAVFAGYNFGHAFLDYLNRTNQDWNINVAEAYSRDVVAPSLDNPTGETQAFINQVSGLYGKPYMYTNGGNFHYVPMAMWHLGFSDEQIRQTALNGGNELVSGGQTLRSREDVLNQSYTYFGDSLVAGTAEQFKATFKNSNAFGTVSMMLKHPTMPELDAMTKLKSLLDNHEVKSNLVIQLGTNNGFTREELEAFIELAGQRHLYFVTTASDVSFAEDVAKLLREAAVRHENVDVIDWLSFVGAKRFEYYGSDRVHFTTEGGERLVQFILDSLLQLSGANEPTEKRFLFNKFQNKNRKQSSLAGGDLVEIAKSQIGLPYSWGGGGKDGPSTGIYDPAVQDATNIVGFDCSGFMQYIYYQAYGVDIGDWTVPQEKSGPIIPKDQLEVGDLLFWGPPGATYHVAMYIGNNELIESSTPGNPIGIHPMRHYDFALRPDVERLKAEQNVTSKP